MSRHSVVLTLILCFLSIAPSRAESIVIATVNNGDMKRMEKLSSEFTKLHPDIKLEWVVFEENVLRQRITSDLANGIGKYDVMTIGTYEAPIWAKRGWLVALGDMGADYDVDDILRPIRDSLSFDDKLFAAPFYGESSMIMYRTDLFKRAGLEMPSAPTWEFIADAARKITDRGAGINGICLRGKAGWGENMALLTVMANSFGARWFDEKWRPQFDSEAWAKTLNFYVNLMKEAGPPRAAANGFNENLSLFQAGKCGMWIDATVAASFVSDPKVSRVASNVGFALAPDAGLGKRTNWLWAWALAVPSSSKRAEAAKTFIAWATSKAYLKLVANTEGWANVPPGTRKSLYDNQSYQKAAPFAKLTLASINAADPTNATVDPVPYKGVQFAAIPEFQCIATSVGQQFAAVLTGELSLQRGLQSAQQIALHQMRNGGYFK